jgi:hypothetical protein
LKHHGRRIVVREKYQKPEVKDLGTKWTRAVEAVACAAQNAEKEATKDQPESVSNEWVPLWVPQQENKIASC